jgi:BirA family transcriptional regulator, biotin operon repressor / biotin---[acetyl-CoA-carboxylase] ligase
VQTENGHAPNPRGAGLQVRWTRNESDAPSRMTPSPPRKDSCSVRNAKTGSFERLKGGWRVSRHSSIDSTNDEARRLAAAGVSGRVWVIADEQTRGRGRRGRSWSSPAGNLYATALLNDPCPAANAPQLGFVAGVALVKAVADLGVEGAALKWPNDLVWRGAKVAGLLVEGEFTAAGCLACVVGVGVNCTSAPQGLAYPTAALCQALGRFVSPSRVFQGLADRFEETLVLWRMGAGFADVRELWLANAAGLGGRIRVVGPRGSTEGQFEGLAEDGRLLLRGPEGLVTIEAADLFLA